MHQFEWCESDLLKWIEKTSKNIKKLQKNACGRAAFLEVLQAAIIFQSIRKLILREKFH